MLSLALLSLFLAPAFCGKTSGGAKIPVLEDGFTPPKWYHGYDGPIFGVTEKRDNMERRTYHPTVWASTNFSDVSFDDAYNKGIKRLDSYWGGKNVPEEKIDSTVPTFMQLYPSSSGKRTLKQKWTVEYFVPHELHARPPAPSVEEVNVMKLPQYDVWIKVFGGYAKENDVREQAFDFFEDLDKAGIKVRKDMFGVAFYDKPYHIFSRHNEIWAWPQPSPSSSEQGVSNEAMQEARTILQGNIEELLRANLPRGA